MTLEGRSWADVRNELFGEPYMVWHDGPEFSGLRDAWRREPEALLEQLFQGMAEGDSLAAQALSELDPAPPADVLARVVAQLEKHVHDSNPSAQVQLGLTLYKLTGDARWTEPIAAVLDSDVFWSNRIDAAMALRHVTPSEPLKQALLRGVQDEDYLVRFHSSTTLRHWAGLGDIDEDDKLFGLLVKEEEPKAWAEVAAELEKL